MALHFATQESGTRIWESFSRLLEEILPPSGCGGEIQKHGQNVAVFTECSWYSAATARSRPPDGSSSVLASPWAMIAAAVKPSVGQKKKKCV